MKYFSLIFAWATVVAVGAAIRIANPTLADPTDDFSFSLGHPAEAEVYDVLSEQKVAEVFRDRLDLFPRSQVAKLAKHLVDLCREYQFDPAFILAMIEVESTFRVKAGSPKGALGLMQVMPATAATVYRDLGIKPLPDSALLDPFVNLSIGVAYLATLRDRYRDVSPYYLVAAYNAGPAKIDDLLLRKTFKPVQTKKYFEDIRRILPTMRFYKASEQGGPGKRTKKAGKKPTVRPIVRSGIGV